MKRIVSLLVALALILSMSVTAFAAGEDQASAIDIANPEFYSQQIAAGDSCWFTYTATGATKITIGNYSGTEFTAADAAGNPITVDMMQDMWGTTYSAEIEVAAGGTAVWQVTATENDYYYFELSAEGEPTWPYVATVGSYTASVAAYSGVYYVYTPDANGTLTLTIDTDASSDWSYAMGADDGWGYPGGDDTGAIRVDDSNVENDSDSEWYPNGHNPSRTINVVAGTAYVLEISTASSAAADVTFSLSFEAGQGGNDSVETIPSGSALALGNNNVELTYATMPMMAPKWTYTATEGGYLTVTVSSINGNSMLGMPFGMGRYTLLVGETDGQGTNTATVYMNANDTVNIAVLDTMDMEAVPAVINLAFAAGEPAVERDPADYFEQAPSGDYILGSLTEAVEIFVGNDDIYFTYTAEADGTLALTATVDGYEATNCAIKVNDGAWAYNAYSAEVSAGDTVRINIWQGFEGSAILLTDGGSNPGGSNPGGSNPGGGNPGGGSQPEGIPSGSALSLGDNAVSLTYAMMPMQAPYWTYTATEGGYLTVTVSSINGNSMLGMPFGMGMYTLLVGETDGQGANTATVYVNANDTVNIAVLDTMDMEAVPAVINLAFATGEPAVERDPADYFEQDPAGNYIIESLENPVEIFVGNDDIYFVYTAESAGAVTLTATVDGYEATNCAIKVNDGDWDWSAAPATVAAGDIVYINVWQGFEGTVTLTEGVGGGDDIESAPMSGENVDVAADESLEIYYTPDADGILTVDISANPGHSILVQNVATEDVIGLPSQSGLAETLTYELSAGVEYKITLTGFTTATWDVAAATITYDITFEAGEISSDVEDLDDSDVALVLGEQNVELLPNTITTLFGFSAPEAGVYTVTIPDDAIAELYSAGWISYQICEGNTLVFTATEAEQNFLIGLTSESDSVNIKIEKTGAYTPPVQTEYKDYVAKNEIEKDFAQPEEVVSVDITAEQTIVKGEDGYYHLGTADGPILMVNLNSEGFTLATLSNAITMRGEVLTDGDGNPWGYDYMTMISDYYEYSRENDYHPLNDDLMAFFKDYGAAQGWYDQNMSGFDAIKAGNFNEESAWMVALVYVESAADNNQGGNNAQTGDFGVIAAAVALGMSAICGTAVVAKKKEN